MNSGFEEEEFSFFPFFPFFQFFWKKKLSS